ncbi:phosphoadenosine phosphosulfate reductase domain-containing protein, partial [Escherichia coli]|uniref:phosphoadenosine phosphosulfate reductase domain-containing protein n=1 Tax=Escherichia coli TaxID=562 RepID=UPI0018D5695A
MVWQWRPVHKWSEKDVWAILERHRIRAHPAYFLGWARCSCMSCIFGSPSQWASVAQIAPRKVIQIRQH